MMKTLKILKICLEWWYTMRMKHINCTMIMPYKLGLVFEKKNSDIQKML